MKKNMYKVIGIPAIICSMVYFFEFVKKTEFPSANKVNTTEEQAISKTSNASESQLWTVQYDKQVR